MSGWIKIHRKMLDWEWYNDVNTFRVFTHLLLTVNHEPSKYRGISLPVGSRIIGRYALAEELGLSERQTRTALEHLKSTSEVTIKTTNRFTVVSITEWAKYQDRNEKTSSKSTSKTPTSDQQPSTSKEEKKLRREEKKDTNVSKENFKPHDLSDQIWDDWMAARKTKRAGKPTQTAMKALEREAVIAGKTVNEAITICAERGWISFKAEYINNTKEMTHENNRTISKQDQARSAIRRGLGLDGIGEDDYAITLDAGTGDALKRH